MTRPSFRRFAGGLIACCTAVSGLALGTAVSASAGASSAHAPQVTGVQKATRCVSTPFRSQPAKTLWYRIPSVVRTNAGTLLAFAEARDNSDASDMGDYDIALARSTDGGCSWSEPRVIASDAANRVASPSAMVDRETGKILLFSNITERPNSGGRGKGLYLQTSTDDGKSFSPLLANQIRPNDDIRGGMPGPGHGIQLTRTNKGRLVVPVVYRTKEGVYGATASTATTTASPGRSATTSWTTAVSRTGSRARSPRRTTATCSSATGPAATALRPGRPGSGGSPRTVAGRWPARG